MFTVLKKRSTDILIDVMLFNNRSIILYTEYRIQNQELEHNLSALKPRARSQLVDIATTKLFSEHAGQCEHSPIRLS